jgi:hypothetical protein
MRLTMVVQVQSSCGLKDHGRSRMHRNAPDLVTAACNGALVRQGQAWMVKTVGYHLLNIVLAFGTGRTGARRHDAGVDARSVVVAEVSLACSAELVGQHRGASYDCAGPGRDNRRRVCITRHRHHGRETVTSFAELQKSPESPDDELEFHLVPWLGARANASTGECSAKRHGRTVARPSCEFGSPNLPHNAGSTAVMIREC